MSAPTGARRALGPVLGVLGALWLTSGPAWAVSSNIDYVEPDGDTLQVVVSVEDVPAGVAPELETVTATFGGEQVPATAEALNDSGVVARTAVLALDVSASMRGEKFEAAKEAASVFLDTVPDDVAVGLVTFAGEVTVAQKPTRETDAVREVLEETTLSRETRLYDGVREAVKISGTKGVRNVLVLSDGRDTSDVKLEATTGAIDKAKVAVDVVALAQGAQGAAPLQQIAKAGNGSVLRADDPKGLSAVFADQAESLASQILVSIEPPTEQAGREGTLAVTVQVDGEPTTDEAFVKLPAAEAPGDTEALAAELQPVEPGFVIPQQWMLAGLVAMTLGVIVVLVIAVGGSPDRSKDELERSIEAYTRKGYRKLAEANRAPQQQSMTQQAVAVAENVLVSQRGLEAALSVRLEAAGLALKPAEWLLLHAGIAIGLGTIGLLLSSGSVLVMLVALALGALLPWVFLSLKKRRRLAAFNGQLADVLQLMAGSLSAGLSLAQSVDTVVREGSDPVAGEFRRALVETRLGVEIEDALMSVAERMQSVDFEWVVMAIRIQRDVGGNLSELLNKVADTIREREYLDRQVKTLSAEGRLSVWILGGLPPGFMLYLTVASPGYVEPMFNHPLGWTMLVVMSVLLTAGIFWMKKLVKVEV